MFQNQYDPLCAACFSHDCYCSKTSMMRCAVRVSAMENQGVVDCQEYKECIGSAIMPQSDGQLISADSWCG